MTGSISITTLVLLIFVTLGSCVNINYVTPHPNTSCPAQPCLTLSQYVQQAERYFTSNATFVFLDGEHILSAHLALRGISNITLTGNTSSLPQVSSEIKCTGPVNIEFDAVSEIKVAALAFASCGMETSNGAAIHLTDVQNFSLSDCILHENAFTALSANHSSLTLNKVTFANNSQSALIFSSAVSSIHDCTFINNSGDQGGAAAIFNSTVNFTGTTVFKGNSAKDSGGSGSGYSGSGYSSSGCRSETEYRYISQGGALYAVSAHLVFEGETTFVSNSALDSGGSLCLQDTTASFTGVNLFQDSHASCRTYWSETEGGYIYRGGGALYATSAHLVFEGETSFVSSSADEGGGIFAIDHTTMNFNGNYGFINNSASGDGGGIYARSGTIMNFSGNYSFINNSASEYGGGIRAESHTTMNFSGNYRFINNSASGGGGIHTYDTTMNFNGIYRFINNSVTNCGGGIYALDITMNFNGNYSFISNSAGFGGGIYALWSHTTGASFSGNYSFINNSAGNGGGGIYAGSGTMVAMNFSGNYSFINNSADQGGGIYTSTTMNFNGNYSFINNSARYYGGGIIAFHSTMNFNGNYSFINNSARYYGGGIDAYTVTMNFNGNYSFNNNSANDGGAIYADSNTTMNFNGNYSFISNSASFDGGGIYAESHTTMNFNENYSFISNSASNGGGIFADDHTTMNFNRNFRFINNSVSQYGGGIYASETTMNFNGNYSFINNSASVDGGGIYAESHTTMNFNENYSFINNSASSDGGGIYTSETTINFDGNYRFINNSASSDGGGIYTSETTINFDGNCDLIDNTATDDGGGIYAIDSSNMNIDGHCSFINNSASKGGGIYASSDATMNLTCSFINNTASQGGAIRADDATLSFHYCSFTHNSAIYGGGIQAQSTTMSFYEDCTFNANSASYGGGIQAFIANVRFYGNCDFNRNSADGLGGGIQALFTDISFNGSCNFINNSATSYGGGGIAATYSNITFNGNHSLINNSAITGGGIAAFHTVMNFTGTCNFVTNSASSGGGLLADCTTVNFQGHFSFINNSADYGGAISITASTCESYMSLAEETRLEFRGNTAKWGGAINVLDNYPLVHAYCSPTRVDLPKHLQRECFLQMYAPNGADNNTIFSLLFEGNSAIEGGDDLYGGTIDTCASHSPQHAKSGEMIDMMCPDLCENKSSAISSDPFRVCACEDNNQPDCDREIGTVRDSNNIPYTVHMVHDVYPGESFPVIAVAIGQRKGTVPAIIRSIFEKDSDADFGIEENIQNTKKTCTTLNYTVFSTASSERMELFVEGPCGFGQPLSILVRLQPCPNGFELSPTTKGCICEKRLQTYADSCDINRQTIFRDSHSEFWVGYDNETGGLILHPHCPFDYCKSEPVNFTLNNTDLQCNYDRSGLLCGNCQPGLSLALGTSQCLECSNAYLTLLVAFVLAGLFLVFFLLICRLTVAVGTINGLIFYANIVAVNQSIFFPQDPNIYGRFLSVFIAWLNLDLGIETCFYSGMDAYTRTWLQFVFPIYIWVLVGLMIISSRYSSVVARTLGTNPVAVLVTLFLLSYAKILRTVIATLTFTNLQYENKTQTVWLYDGNITYLSGKHIPLFITALAVFLMLFLPYTLLLLTGQFLAKSNHKVVAWLYSRKLKPFMDAYHGPYKNEHRYWPGLLLVVRVILLIIFSSNPLNDASVNLLAISTCVIGLLTLVWLIRGIYKKWYLEALEAFFILNLGILAVATFYVRATGGSQAAVAYTSVSAVFVVFVGIITYHVYLQLRDSRIWKRMQNIQAHRVPQDDNEIEAPPQIETGVRIIDEEARAAVPMTVITVPADREPLMFVAD